MEKVCEELDEAKAEIERLRTEQMAKAQLCESLKIAHNEQIAKIQEANVKIEKQAQELNEKADEISFTKQMYEEIKSSMKEKEAIINRLSSANDEIRINYDEKLMKLERENRELIVALDEASSKNMDQEQKLCACKEEIRGLKSLLSASDKKCLEIEKKAKEFKELRLKDDMLVKLEEEKMKVEDQLKWKKEQFRHLEEAHEQLRGQLQASKKEWELEKSTLLDEISILQTNLDSQTRISEGLQSRLQMCNQALAHEESRRKYMEVQLSETRTHFDNVFTEFEEAKSKIECLTDQRGNDIASLRNLLGEKEMVHKEMEYQFERLEQENQELRFSIKELQEAQIQEAGTSSSLSKLRNKLKGLEQMNRDCSKNLRAKEAEWTTEFEKMAGDLRNYRSELESKDTAIKELKMELEVCHSLIMNLELQNEESSMMLMLIKSEFCETQLKLKNEMASLLSKAESLCFVEQKLQLQDEIERLKELLKESSECQLRLKEKISQVELDLVNVNAALNKANDELFEKFCEGHELEFEFQIWKSTVERLKADLEQNQQLRKEVEASLLAQIEVEVTLKQERESLGRALEEKERGIEDLERQIVLLKRKKEENALQRTKEKERRMSNGLLKETECLEQECMRIGLEGAIFAHINAERTYEHQKDNFQRLLEEKDRRIDDLHEILMLLEQKFKSLTTSFSSQLAEKQEELNLLQKAWEKIATDEVMKEFEIQEKKMVIADLKAKQLEVKKLTADLRSSETTIGQLESEKRNLLEDLKKLMADKEILLDLTRSLSERMSEFCVEDTQLMGVWEKIVQKFDKNIIVMDLKGDDDDDDDLFDTLKENKNVHPSFFLEKRAETGIVDERSPFRVLNN
ncbi:hypothetical protein U1Q18_043254 [Sarracenia purpurea var. burkii]